MAEILPLAMLVLGLTIIDATLASAAFFRSRRKYRFAFVAMMVMEVVMAWGYLMDVNAASIDDKLLWNNLEYIGYLGIIPISFIFAARFIGNEHLDRRRVAALLIVPVSLWIALVLNQYHHLFYVDVSLANNQFISIKATYGPLFYIYEAFTIFVVAAALFIIMRRYFGTSGRHRNHIGIVAMSFMIPLAATVINYVELTQIPGPFLVMASLFVSGILFYVGAFRFEMFDIVPYAFDRVVGTIKDSVFVIDERGMIMFMNASASSLTGKGMEQAYHRRFDDIMPGGGQLSKVLASPAEASLCVEPVSGRFFDMSVTPIMDPGQRPVGRLVILHEITEDRKAKCLEMEGWEKTRVLNSITRHDISNQLAVIEGNASLLSGKVTDESAKRKLALISMATKNIAGQLAFLRSYQEIGVKDPEWMDIDSMISSVALPLADKGVDIRVETRRAEILADPQMEKVFYNLIDNSLTHAKGISLITVKLIEHPETVELVYQDNGPGISQECREHLFEMSQDGIHGVGLYLSKKILAMTGMTISENGGQGEGVRFVISVPPENIRRAADRS
jgi:signal transduction histidine kinase